MADLTIREVDGTNGRKLKVVDSFPDEFTASDTLLRAADQGTISYDEQRGRAWVRVANGSAEYVVEKATYGNSYRCLRIYQDVQWTPPPLPKPEPVASAAPVPAPSMDYMC